VPPVLTALIGVVLATGAPGQAANIPINLDLNILRPPLPNEGSLHFIEGGEDLTGWIDIRNPAFYDGTDGRPTTITNTTKPRCIGYDRSDFQVRIQIVIATHRNGMTAGA